MKTTRAMAAMALLTSVLATSACGGRQLPEGQEIEPIVHLAGGHIEFNRSCADEEPYTTRAYTLMDSGDGRASALVTVIAGYLPSTGTRVVVGVELVATRAPCRDELGRDLLHAEDEGPYEREARPRTGGGDLPGE